MDFKFSVYFAWGILGFLVAGAVVPVLATKKKNLEKTEYNQEVPVFGAVDWAVDKEAALAELVNQSQFIKNWYEELALSYEEDEDEPVKKDILELLSGIEGLVDITQELDSENEKDPEELKARAIKTLAINLGSLLLQQKAGKKLALSAFSNDQLLGFLRAGDILGLPEEFTQQLVRPFIDKFAVNFEQNIENPYLEEELGQIAQYIGGTDAKKKVLALLPESEMASFNVHSVHDVAFSSDSSLAMTSGPDGNVYIWDAKTGKQKQIIPVDKGYPSLLLLSSNGKVLALGGLEGDSSLLVWDVEAKKVLRELKVNKLLLSAAFSPDNKYIAVQGENLEDVLIYDLSSGEVAKILEAPKDVSSAYSIKYSPDGKHLAAGFSNGEAALWNAETGKLVQALSNSANGKAHEDGFIRIAFSPDGSKLATASDKADGSVAFWNGVTGEYLESIKTYDDDGYYGISDVVFSPDGRYIGIARYTGNVYVFDVVNTQKSWTLAGHKNGQTSLSFSPDSNYIATASLDKTMRLWDFKREQCLRTFESEEDVKGMSLESPFGSKIKNKKPFNKVVFSPDGEDLLASIAISFLGGSMHMNNPCPLLWHIAKTIVLTPAEAIVLEAFRKSQLEKVRITDPTSYGAEVIAKINSHGVTLIPAEISEELDSESEEEDL